MTLPRRMKLGLWTLAGMVVLAITGKLVLGLLYPTDLRTQLARALGVRPEVFWINLPPAKHRLPGAAFVYASTLLPIDGVESDPADVSAGAEFDLGWVNSTGSRLNANADASILSLAYSDRAHLKVRLHAEHCRTLEAPLDKLKQRILHSDEIRSQVAEGHKPLIVVRSYEGVITIDVSKTQATSAETWNQVKTTAAASTATPDSKVSIAGSGDDSMRMTFKDPIVFAYEMVEAKLITTHLGAEPDDVQFTPVTEPADAAKATTNPAVSDASDPRRWILATVAVSDFPKTPWLQQDWNRSSADSVAHALRLFAPTETPLYRSTRTTPSTAEDIRRFAERVAQQAHAIGARLVVFYYVGHSITSSTGEIFLLQGGATPADIKALANPPSAPALANLQDIVRVVRAATPVDSNVALRLSDLHEALAETHVPFIILLDGCMGSSFVRQTMETAGFRYDPAHPTLYYIGDEPLTHHVIDTVAASMQNFGGQWGYLHDLNPIVLAAKPGTLAMIADDPNWEAAPPLAPLAQKVSRLLEPSVGDRVTSLNELINRMVDFRQGVGELELSGSISWSDFSALEHAARMLDRSDVRLPYFDAQRAVIQEYRPNIGPIGGFYFNPDQQRLFLVSQGNDWKIWSWTAHEKRLISDRLTFPMVAGTRSGEVYLHHDDGKTLARLEGMRLVPVKSPLYIERLATGRNVDELLIAGEAASTGEVAPIWFLRNNQLVEIDRFRTSGLWSLAPVGAQGIAYTRDAGAAVMIRDGGHERALAQGLIEPGELASVGDEVYCLSRSKLRLYRLSPTGVSEAPLLNASGDALLEASRDPDGFQATPTGTLLITSGASIIEIAPEQLRWSPHV